MIFVNTYLSFEIFQLIRISILNKVIQLGNTIKFLE